MWSENERRESRRHQTDCGPVEELPTADADRLGIRSRPHGRRLRLGLDERGAAIGDGRSLDLAAGRRDREVDLGVAIAALRLPAERARAADVAALGRRDEGDGAEHDDDGDDDGDDCC